MPMDRSRYPHNWEEISYDIRFGRANGCCEQCGARHGDTIIRSPNNPASFVVSNGDEAFDFGSPYNGKASKVVLTTHHIGIMRDDGTPGDPHDKMDVRPANLISLCQRCHFIADIEIHIKNARLSRLAKKRHNQKSLFTESDLT